MSAYTGFIVRIANSADARSLPGPSPRHAVDESDPSQAAGEHTVPSGTGSEYGGSAFDQNVLPGGGMQLDTPTSWARDLDANASQIKYKGATPHDSLAVLSARQGDMADGGRLSAHDGRQDRGWLRLRFSPAPIADELQPQEATRTDGYSNPFGALGEPDGVKYVRGRGSRPETNPDGFRLGVLQRWAWTGDAAKHVRREQGVQVTQPRDSYAAPARQRMVKDMLTDVALPRTSASFDDNLMAQSDASNPTAGSSFGGF